MTALFDAAENVAAAAREYVGDRPLELIRERDSQDGSLIGALADPKWVRLVEALVAWEAIQRGN